MFGWAGKRFVNSLVRRVKQLEDGNWNFRDELDKKFDGLKKEIDHHIEQKILEVLSRDGKKRTDKGALEKR